MATTVHEPPDIQSRPALSDDGGWHDLTPSAGTLTAVEDSSPASRTGIWVGMAAITMTFVAITSAMVVRQGASMDWRHFTLPSVLYLDTVILLASSCHPGSGPQTCSGSSPGECSRAARFRCCGCGSRWDWDCCSSAGNMLAWLQLKARGLVPGHQSQQFVLLPVYGHAWPARARGTGGFDVGDLAVQQAGFDPAPEHAEYGFVLLAFHGCALDLPAAVAVGANLTSRREEAL